MHAQHQARVALVTAIMGGDNVWGRSLAHRTSDDGTRLVLVGDPSSKQELEQVGRHCARNGAPAVDIYAMQDVTDLEVCHTLMRTIISRQGGVDLLVLCPFRLLLWNSSEATVVQMMERCKEEVRQLMAERQQGDTRCVRGIISIIPDPGSGTNITGTVRSGAAQGVDIMAQAASKLGLNVAKQARAPALASVKLLGAKMQEWSSRTAEAVCDAGITVVDVIVPAEVVHASLLLEEQGKGQQAVDVQRGTDQRAGQEYDERATTVRNVAEAAADVALSPWLYKDTFREAGAHVRVAIDSNGQRGPMSLRQPSVPGPVAAFHEVALRGPPEAQDNKSLPGQRPDGRTGVFGGLGGGGDPEGLSLGHDPGPSKSGTLRVLPGGATWVKALDPPPAEGIIEATGARKAPGALTRVRARGELGLGKQDKPGAVIINADPDNLEPSMSKEDYQDEPTNRDPAMMVHCWYPFNAETPHRVLSEKFITPAALFYVRNHLPVPKVEDASQHTLRVGGLGLTQEQEVPLQGLQAGQYGPVLDQQVTLQCAGNRRNELAAIKLVEGRAPWNHGAIGNGLWTGVMVRDVLASLGFPVNDPLSVVHVAIRPHAHLQQPPAGQEARAPSLHLIMQGLDWHRRTGKHFEVSIPLDKALDPQGGVMLAWAQDHKPLLPDHGFPLRAIVPGFVGTRSVKWIQSMRVADEESESAWQRVDYKLMPHKYHTLPEWKPKAHTLPGIENMNTQSAILEPEAGTVIDTSRVKALWVRGYAWCGAGLPIIRVDVTADEGSTWELADIVEQHHAQHGQAWAWVKWQVPLQVPPAVSANGGKWRIGVKAFNRNGDTQSANPADIWNFRGLACNAWHFVDLHVVRS